MVSFTNKMLSEGRLTMNRIYDNAYLQIHGKLPPHSITFGESKADILCKNRIKNTARGFMESFDYTMQTQVGCPGG